MKATFYARFIEEEGTFDITEFVKHRPYTGLSKQVNPTTGSEYHYDANGLFHRSDGPAIIEKYNPRSKKSFQAYFQHGTLHRTDGPAMILPNGTIVYIHQGKLHRTEGPAIVFVSGARWYYHQGKKHRTDGPAIIDRGHEEYWFNGQRRCVP